MSLTVPEVREMFNYIESNIHNDTIIKGGANDTEPYNTFRSGLNRIYDYFSVIFTNNNSNSEKYQASVNNLDKSCDCSKFKCKKEEYLESDDQDDMGDENDIDNASDVIQKIDMKNDNYTNEETPQSKLLLKVSKII